MMKKSLHYITMFCGILMISKGIATELDMIDTFKLYWGENYLTIPAKRGIVYTIIVNFIGGISLLYHAVSTIHFGEYPNPPKEDSPLEIVKSSKRRSPLSGLQLITGFISLLTSFWLVIHLLFMIEELSVYFGQMWQLISMLIIGYGVFALVPILLSSINVSLHNKIRAGMNR